MRGQVSTELLVIVALVLLIFIPLLVLVYFKANEANQQIASYQAELAVTRLASLANSVGSLGTNTTVVTDVYIPPNTQSFTVMNAGSGSEIDMSVNTPQGVTDVVDVINYPVTSNGPIATTNSAGGWMKIRITSVEAGTPPQATIDIEKQ